jgi:glycosyltransferase involved in cell wall biosynthesis
MKNELQHSRYDAFSDPNVQAADKALPRIAVLIPCYNEAVSIGKVVADFRDALPRAEIFVYDNNSQDETIAIARSAGALVRMVKRQGKGNVVRCMFADVDADMYVLVDGDDTYYALSAPEMVKRMLSEQLDMVVGVRQTSEVAAYRAGHRFGNAVLTWFVAYLFGRDFTDILSGYRVFSRRFVKSFPALASGFETETELTVHALELRMPVGEVVTPYGSRPVGSESKLRTYRDGLKILLTILRLVRAERPLRFYSAIGVAFLTVSIVIAIPLLVTGLALTGGLSFVAGLVLDAVTLGRREVRRLAYLMHPPPGER